MITHLINSNHLAICMMKSNIVIHVVRSRPTYLEMSLHSSDMDRDAELVLFVIHRIGIAIFFNSPMLNLFESLLILLSSDEHL